jgi:hypothetical protein
MRNPAIPQKIPVFVAGEGKSEEGYWRWLARFPRILAIRAEGLAGGDLLEMAECAIHKLNRWRGAGITHRALVLDSEHEGGSPDRRRRALQLIERHRFHLIVQRPCHEAFIIRHFIGWENHKPSTQQDAERLLVKVWPRYEKGMDAGEYTKILTPDHVAVARGVEPQFDAFLSRIGW